MIKYLQERWLLWRKPYSVAIRGRESGTLHPPLTFLRFCTWTEADRWILHKELTGTLDLNHRLTDWVVVDLRVSEQDLIPQ